MYWLDINNLITGAVNKFEMTCSSYKTKLLKKELILLLRNFFELKLIFQLKFLNDNS